MSGGGGAPKQKETANEKALAQVSRKQINRYQDKYSPLIGELDDLSQEDRSAELRGMGNADLMQSLGNKAPVPRANGRGSEVQPTAQRALGSALTGGTRANDDRQAALTKGVTDASMGSAQTAMDGMRTAASISNQEARSKLQADITKRQQNLDLVGAAAGAATSYGVNSIGKKPSRTLGSRPQVKSFIDTGNGMRDSRTGYSGIGL